MIVTKSCLIKDYKKAQNLQVIHVYFLEERASSHYLILASLKLKIKAPWFDVHARKLLFKVNGLLIFRKKQLK